LLACDRGRPDAPFFLSLLCFREPRFPSGKHEGQPQPSTTMSQIPNEVSKFRPLATAVGSCAHVYGSVG